MFHQDITHDRIHPMGYVQSGNPGAIGAGRVWVDTSAGTGLWVVKIRNAANDGWEAGSTGGSSSLVIVISAIAYDDTSGTIAVIPANSIIMKTRIPLTEAWDWGGSGDFELGTAGDPDLLLNKEEADLDGSVPDCETKDHDLLVVAETTIQAAWTQDGATTGAGWIVIEYLALS